MKYCLTPAISIVCFLLAPSAGAADVGKPDGISGPYRPTWESLKAHKDPEWFRDAKFGIYTHWGPVTVGSEDCPAGGQWYGHEMYDPKSGVFAFHQQRFGDQKKVGYKDIIPRFKAEKFDAEAWATLFARSGARFAGPVAVHHDNFAMWDSAVTPWNAVKMGPHRDITGELEKAIKRHGMKFITTFHHGFAWRYFEPAFAFDGGDPRYALLYTESHKPGAPPSKAYLDKWLGMVNEVVGKYQPDMIWFDFELMAVITPEYQQRMFADYYNWAAKNQRDSAVAHKFREIHRYTGILDFERGREDRLVPYPWLTDTALAEWFNQKSAPYRSMDNLVQVFVDIVAKNGCMLLDVSPAADGTIPDQARKMLLGMGDWLKINGEAVYGTRPWLVYGEGPTKGKGGGFSEGADKPFTAKDIRFTTKGDTLYAIALGWPEDRRLVIKSLASDAGKVTAVSLLGHAGALTWTQGQQGLEVTLPAEKPCQHAFALKVLGAGLKPPPAAQVQPVRPAADGSVTHLSWPGEKIDTWNGFARHTFSVDGCTAWVVEPKQALPGKPWSWCMEFPDAFTERCAAPALLKKGFYHAHISVGNTFGSPAAVRHFNAFYAAVTGKGLAKKVTLIGISRGGLYCYRWASEDPERVAVIYGDAAVCDFKSWPGGKGKGLGSPGDWKALLSCYGFKDDAEALAYQGNPVDVLAPLAKANVALIHVVGDADNVVPPAENTALVEERYKKLGGTIQVIHKPGVGHHPHGLDNPTPVVEFIVKHGSVGGK